MKYVYMLRSLTSGMIYVGITENIEVRLKEHNTGKSKFTKGHLPWELIYHEGPFDTPIAREREKRLKRTDVKRRILEKL